MKVIVPGHKYEVAGSADTGPQTISFLHKIFNTGSEESYPGTTNEEILKVLIDRLSFLQYKLPCRENAIVITKLEESLMWLEKRTADRLDRGVEGSSAA